MPLTKTELIYLIKTDILTHMLQRYYYHQYLQQGPLGIEWNLKALIKLTDTQLCEIYLNSRIISVAYPI